ncbi:tetratricopeptide repeat protein [Geminocystis sp. GBBB08]|uniref:tetratricopeptide repeat protein n=1 Tax=Geminocystis sp. GBBB08 TaxID=2604140 RepID=UPI0027E2A626|nr:tetratricopeptide repeat protein [Geminocystis sp. GBBB08]MBL1208791.1 tetratricopeptide repeat protein [Geminocystis sp. GBBB08]
MLRLIIVTVLFCLFFFNTPTIATEIINTPFTEAQLQEGENIAEEALKATEKGDFTLAENYWSQLIEKFPTNPAVWSNRGNARVSQNKLEEAIADYNESIKLAPNAPDPYLNRGTAYESLKEYEKAIADYEKVLTLDPEDAMAYNNLGNAKAGLKDWETAVKYYHKATELSPQFAFAGANESLALYQIGKKDEALKKMRNLVRKYPMFPDMRAALTAVLWENGKQGEAESNWVATIGIDSRYKDVEWLKEVRRWPPNMVVALEKFLTIDGN